MSTFKSFLKESTWEYTIPKKDAQQRLIDFYTMALLSFAEPKNSLLPGINSHIEDNVKTIRESFLELERFLKVDLLDALYTCMISELRHADDINTADKVLEAARRHNIEEKFKKFYRKFRSNQLMGDIKPQYKRTGTREPDGFTRYSNATKAAKYAGLTGQELANFGKDVFVSLRWDSGYGGEPWKQACEAYLQLEKANTTKELSIAIDHILDLEHNNGTLLNKNRRYKQNGGFEWIKKFLDFKREASPHDLMERSSVPESVYAPILRVMNLSKSDLKMFDMKPVPQKSLDGTPNNLEDIDVIVNRLNNNAAKRLSKSLSTKGKSSPEYISIEDRYNKIKSVLSINNIPISDLGNLQDWRIHKNGGGLVNKKALVEDSVFIGKDVIVLEGIVNDKSKLEGNVLIAGNVKIEKEASIKGIADKHSIIWGNYGKGIIISDIASISGYFIIKNSGEKPSSLPIEIDGATHLSNTSISGGNVTITDTALIQNTVITSHSHIRGGVIIANSTIGNCDIGDYCNISDLSIFPAKNCTIRIRDKVKIKKLHIDTVTSVELSGNINIEHKEIINQERNSRLIKISTQEEVDKLDTNEATKNTKTNSSLSEQQVKYVKWHIEYLKNLKSTERLKTPIEFGDESEWHIHPNGNGLVHRDAKVDDTVFLGKDVIVHSGTIKDKVSITGKILIAGKPLIKNSVSIVVGNNELSYIIQYTSSVVLKDNALIKDSIFILGGLRVYGQAILQNVKAIGHNNTITEKSVVVNTIIDDVVYISGSSIVRKSSLSWTSVKDYAQVNNSVISPTKLHTDRINILNNSILNNVKIVSGGVSIEDNVELNKKFIDASVIINNNNLDKVIPQLKINNYELVVDIGDDERNEIDFRGDKKPIGNGEKLYIEDIISNLTKVNSTIKFGSMSDWHIHPNGGGLVHKNAKVDSSVFLSKGVVIGKSVTISDYVSIHGHIFISGAVKIIGNVIIDTSVKFLSYIIPDGNNYVVIKDKVLIKEKILISGGCSIFNNANLNDVAISGSGNVIFNYAVVSESTLNGENFIHEKATVTKCILTKTTCRDSASISNSTVEGSAVISNNSEIDLCDINGYNFHIMSAVKLYKCKIMLNNITLAGTFSINGKLIDKSIFGPPLYKDNPSDIISALKDVDLTTESISKITKYLLLDDTTSVKLIFEELLSECIRRKLMGKKRFILEGIK